MKKLTSFIVGSMVLPVGAQAALTLASLYTGNVGSSIDGVGGNGSPVGTIGAEIPVGATIRKAYLYAAGTPSPWDANAPTSLADYPTSLADYPTSLADYNSAGITLGGTAITNFSKLVGSNASLNRPEIGMFFTGRADVTSAVQTLIAANPAASSHSWSYAEGAGRNSSIDGGVLAIAYEHPSLPLGSVAFFDGGQETGGETSLPQGSVRSEGQARTETSGSNLRSHTHR